MKKRKGIDGQLDAVWSELVKARAGYKCEYCGTERNLNSHHIFSRSKKSVRWHPQNGICLCVSHHTFSSRFSAHLTPTEFTYWLIRVKGEDYMDRLTIRAHSVCKLTTFEKGLILEEMKKEIKELL